MSIDFESDRLYGSDHPIGRLICIFVNGTKQMMRLLNEIDRLIIIFWSAEKKSHLNLM